MYNDTIAAVATCPGEAAIGVIRLSGPDALTILKRVFRRGAASVEHLESTRFEPDSHRLYYGYVIDPDSGKTIDEVMAVYMAPPHTYTREATVEISAHGGQVPTRSVLSAVLKAGARPANPGEFTLRAFLNGRLDLSQAEAVIDIIRARTPAALAAGLGQLEGTLSGRVQAIRRTLLLALARIEAVIDFPEEDIPESDPTAGIQEAIGDIDKVLATAGAGTIYREGVRTTITGVPNVGKSSLLNALLRFERAIVTEIPGTTRDTLEETINICGVPFVLVDTAGIADTTDVVERLGVERSRAAIAASDLVILVLDSSRELSERDMEVASIVQTLSRQDADGHGHMLIALNKSDLTPALDEREISERFPGVPVVQTSAVTSGGFEGLEKAMVDTVFSGKIVPASEVLVTNVRHEVLLREARDSLADASEAANTLLPAEIVAVDIRNAIDYLGQITGETASESLLDQIFSEFCIGK